MTEPTGPRHGGLLLRDARKDLGLSAVEMGRALGYEGQDNTVSVTVRRYESGQRPVPPWIARLIEMYRRFGLPEDLR